MWALLGWLQAIAKLGNWISRYVERAGMRRDGRNAQIVDSLKVRKRRRRRAAAAVPIRMSDDPQNRDR